MDAHLLAAEIDQRRWTLADIFPLAQKVDRDRGVMAVRHRPDDVLGPKGGVTAKENPRIGGLHGLRIDLGHIPFVEFDADVALDPGKGILLADGHQDIVGVHHHIRFARRHQLAAALGIIFGFDLLEPHAGQLAVRVQEFRRDEKIVDRDAFMHRVFFFPRARLSFPQSLTAPRHSLARRQACATYGSNPSRCCRRPAR